MRTTPTVTEVAPARPLDPHRARGGSCPASSAAMTTRSSPARRRPHGAGASRNAASTKRVGAEGSHGGDRRRDRELLRGARRLSSPQRHDQHGRAGRPAPGQARGTGRVAACCSPSLSDERVAGDRAADRERDEHAVGSAPDAADEHDADRDGRTPAAAPGETCRPSTIAVPSSTSNGARASARPG